MKKTETMDYKYIEQLLERYWAAETTVAEERVLRAFFSQNDVPAQLARYKDLFDYQGLAAAAEAPGEDFDRRLLELAGQTAGAGKEQRRTVRAHRLTLAHRLRPLYHAAASVAIVMLLGTAAQHAFDRPQETAGWDYNAAAYKDSYDNPQEAYETLDDGIRELREVLLMSDGGAADSLSVPETPQP